MSLNPKDLQRKASLGNIHAKQVLPFRQNVHLSLAAILLTNIAAVSATSIVLSGIVYGVIAGVMTTLLIVVFGEIFPQAIFNRNALIYTARLRLILRLMIIATYVVSKPLQLLLDRLFTKEEAPQLQSRHELGMMISEHLGPQESELDNDEIEIIRGALRLSEKRVRDIMTPIDNVFWLMPNTILTNERIEKIKTEGRSRIPVFNAKHSECHGVLLMKELVDIDFSERQYRVDSLNLYPVKTIGYRTALDTMFRKFIASGTHLIPIEKENIIIGIVTIEDLIEEIVGHEIEDETDRHKKRATTL